MTSHLFRHTVLRLSFLMIFAGECLAQSSSVSLESISFKGQGYWDELEGCLDLSSEIDKIKHDAEMAERDSVNEDDFTSTLFISEPGYDQLMNSRTIPRLHLLKEAGYLFVGDSGRPVTVEVTLKNSGASSESIRSIRLVVDDFLAQDTTRGDGILELESISLDPEIPIALPWPTGFLAEPQDFHDERTQRYEDFVNGKPLRSEEGYNQTLTELPEPIFIPAGSTRTIELQIDSKLYPLKYGFGCSHYRMHFGFLTSTGEIQSKGIYWIGSHWWMF